jgi:hypothetical protein
MNNHHGVISRRGTGQRSRVGRPLIRFLAMADLAPVPRLRPRPYLPIAGAVLGAAAGFAYYWYFGCDSG